MIARQSVKVWTWRRMLRDHGPRKPGLLLTLHTIGTWMDGDGYCYPSQKEIAKGARISDRTVKRHVAEAVELGWLHTEQGPMGGKGWRLTAYHATVPRDVELPDADEGLTDTLYSQTGDIGDEYEGEDTIVSPPYYEGRDAIVSPRCATDSESRSLARIPGTGKVGTSDAKVGTPVTEGGDTGDHIVGTQLCPTNSPVNSPVELSKTEGAAEAAPLAVDESEVLPMTARRKNGMQHIAGATRDRGEPVLQVRPSAPPIGSAEYRRNAVIRLARKGYAPDDIAKFTGLEPAAISAVLNGAPA